MRTVPSSGVPDWRNNAKLKNETILQKERAQKAKLDANIIYNEKIELNEKQSQLDIVNNRVAYLKKKINEVNGQIGKQDNLINKIKSNQERYQEEMDRRQFYKSNINSNEGQNREIINMRRDQNRQAISEHQLLILKQKQDRVRETRLQSIDCDTIKHKINQDYENYNQMRSTQVKEVHTIQEVLKKQKEQGNDKHLTHKFEKRVMETKEKKLAVSSEIEQLENIEKALMEQLSRTTQKRDEKMQIIKDINSSNRHMKTENSNQ